MTDADRRRLVRDADRLLRAAGHDTGIENERALVDGWLASGASNSALVDDEGAREAQTEWYSRARRWVHVAPWRTPRELALWSLHIEGIGFREIERILGIPRSVAHREVQQLTVEMERDLDRWELVNDSPRGAHGETAHSVRGRFSHGSGYGGSARVIARNNRRAGEQAAAFRGRSTAGRAGEPDAV